MCSGSWPLSTFCDQVGDDVAQRQLQVARVDLVVAAGPPLADADAVERPDDRVRQSVLLACPLGEILHRQLLEPVGRGRRRRSAAGRLPRVGKCAVFSKTIEDERTVIFCSRPCRWASMAASKAAAVIRSFSAIRSYASRWK